MGMLFQIVFGLQTLWFIMAIVGGLSAYKKFIPEGNLRMTRLALWSACIGESLLCVIYAYGIVHGSGGLAMLMLGLWGYFTYRDITTLSRTY